MSWQPTKQQPSLPVTILLQHRLAIAGSGRGALCPVYIESATAKRLEATLTQVLSLSRNWVCKHHRFTLHATGCQTTLGHSTHRCRSMAPGEHSADGGQTRSHLHPAYRAGGGEEERQRPSLPRAWKAAACYRGYLGTLAQWHCGELHAYCTCMAVVVVFLMLHTLYRACSPDLATHILDTWPC